MVARPVTLARAADFAAAPQPIHILLYALIPADRACLPIRRGPAAFLRNRTRRLLELMSWRFLGLWRAHYSTFKEATNTNRGDIAIRMGVKQQLVEVFPQHSVKFTEIAWGELNSALYLRSTIDLVVIAGGGFLFADKDGHLPPRFKADLEVLACLHCPIVAASIGVNHLFEGNQRKLFKFHRDSRTDVLHFLSYLTRASVRDDNTQQALALPGRPQLPVIVDPAFLLAPASPASKTAAGTQMAPLKVGLNMAFHGAKTTAGSHVLLPIFFRALKRLQRETGCQFYYFVHSDGERGIADALRAAGLPLELVHTDVEHMLDAYRQMDVHVGQMLHSAIFATNVGTPTLNLAYDIKSVGFFNLLGLSDLCVDVTDIDEDKILAAIRSLIATRHNISTILIARRAELAKQSRDFYADIAALVAADFEHLAVETLPELPNPTAPALLATTGSR